MTPRPINLFEYEARARAGLAGPAFDYYVSGAHDELTLRDNRAAYERLRLAYRVLVDVSERDLTTTVLGTPIEVPLLVAPTAFHRMAHPDGELATVRAAGSAGTIMILSSLSTTAVEEVVAAASGPVWFQLYVYRDRAATEGLIARAEAAGCEAIVLTVDAPRLGRRERDVRNRFHLPQGLTVANMLPAGYGAVDQVDQQLAESGLAAYFSSLIDPSLSWDDLEWLRGRTSLPLLLKGVVRPDDAVRAVEHGVAGIVVSNHGGRQLDTSIATLDALPGIAAAVGDRVPVLLDGGARRGTDVLKALALGARAVCVGRPIVWGLAADGQAGAEHVLTILREELDLAMALCGAPTLASITADLLVPGAPSA
ncbi:MAG: alpha-hydroxy acid oxidase [Nannocystaceae bacterium]